MRVIRGWADFDLTEAEDLSLTPGTPTKVTIREPDGTSRTITATYVQAGPEIVAKPAAKWLLPVALGAGGLVVLGLMFSVVGGRR